MKIIDLN